MVRSYRIISPRVVSGPPQRVTQRELSVDLDHLIRFTSQSEGLDFLSGFLSDTLRSTIDQCVSLDCFYVVNSCAQLHWTTSGKKKKALHTPAEGTSLLRLWGSTSFLTSIYHAKVPFSSFPSIDMVILSQGGQ